MGNYFPYGKFPIWVISHLGNFPYGKLFPIWKLSHLGNNFSYGKLFPIWEIYQIGMFLCCILMSKAFRLVRQTETTLFWWGRGRGRGGKEWVGDRGQNWKGDWSMFTQHYKACLVTFGLLLSELTMKIRK